MICESEKSVQKEKNVAQGITILLKSDGFGERVADNRYSDVAIHKHGEARDTYVEVKLDETAPLGKYSCQFTAQRGFVLDFGRLRKEEVDSDLFTQTKNAITDRIQQILNDDIKEKLSRNLNNIKDQINIFLKDKLRSKNGSLFTKSGNARKGIVFDAERLQISDISFPLFLNKLRDFFDALNREDQEKYISIRNEIRKHVNPEYVERFDEVIVSTLNDNSIQTIEKSVDFLQERDVFLDIGKVQELLQLLKDIYVKYHDMLQELDIDNDPSRTINKIEPIERTCYTYKYFIEATDRDQVKLQYITDNGTKSRSFTIQAQSFGVGTPEFGNLIDSVIDYYRNFDDVAYFQIGKYAMNLKRGDKRYDPLNVQDILMDFKDFYQSVRFNLYVISEVKNSQNMYMRLYVNGFNHNPDRYKYSFDPTDDNFDRGLYFDAMNRKEDQEEINERIEFLLRNENLTIPVNDGDDLEKKLYKKLEKNYVHADRIVRWYRNAKKSGMDEKQLENTFIDNLGNITDLLKTYDGYIESLKRMKLLNKKISVSSNGREFRFDPVKDVDKIRMLDGFRAFVRAIGDEVQSDTSIDTTERKYAITDEDRVKIRIIGYTENVVCWCTEGYETTNKFIFQLWQNSKTLGRGDVYGDPSEQTPYCTHSKEHWDEYSYGYSGYQQFWYLKRVDALFNEKREASIEKKPNAANDYGSYPNQVSDLVKQIEYKKGNLNDKEVVRIFKLMKGTGAETLVAMNDSNSDFLDRNDEHFYGNFERLGALGKEVGHLNGILLSNESTEHEVVLGGKKFLMTKYGQKLSVVGDEHDYRIEEFHGEFSPPVTTDDTSIGTAEDLTTLVGLPKKMSGSIQIEYAENLKSLVGMPQEFKGSIYLLSIPLENLDGFPKRIQSCMSMNGEYRMKQISIYDTHIKNLIGLQDVPSYYILALCNNNQLINLEGCPNKIDTIDVSWCKNLETLKGIGSEVSQLTIRGCDNLKTLDYAPYKCEGIGHFRSEYIPEEVFDEYKKWTYEFLHPEKRDERGEQLKKLILWMKIHLQEDGMHYRQSGPTREEALSMDIKELEELVHQARGLNESRMDEMDTSDTASSRFEIEIRDKIREFLDSQEDEKYRSLLVDHYEGSDSKFHSDVFVTNPKNGKQVWIEVKKNRYANLGGFSYKFKDGKWSTTTVDAENPLAVTYLRILEEHGRNFVEFCKKYTGKDDISIPRDIDDGLLDAWKKSGNVTDTENETQFITDKIRIGDFGRVVAKYYETAKAEPVYYMQVADDLYIINPDYNPLDLHTSDGDDLKTVAEAYKIGRIQFRVKAMNKNGKRYFCVTQDIKVLSDRNLEDND